MAIYNSPVLILEQSPIVVKQLVRYLSKLGFKQVFPFNDVSKAIGKFSDLVNEKHEPLVFLAFDHGNTNAISILPQFYQISINTKIIIETARNRNDDCIRQLISMGVFYFVTKPFFFDDIEQVINTMQNDDDILSDFMEKDKEFLIKILDTVQRISVARLSELAKMNKDKIASILNQLKKENKIMIMGTINEAACKSCDSVQVSPIFFCKSCTSSNFGKQKLIEHVRCGNVSLDQDYSNDKCPSCRKQIISLGVDYKISFMYMCTDCSNKFQFPEFNIVCLACGYKSTLDELKWIKSQSMLSLNATKNNITIDNFENVLESEFGISGSTHPNLAVNSI